MACNLVSYRTNSAVEALKKAYTPGNRAIKFFARLRKIDVIELACKFLTMPLLKNSRHKLFAQLIASGTCSAAEAYRRAGGRTKNADVIACRWLRKVSIKEGIAELKGARCREMRHDARADRQGAGWNYH